MLSPLVVKTIDTDQVVEFAALLWIYNSCIVRFFFFLMVFTL